MERVVRLNQLSVAGNGRHLIPLLRVAVVSVVFTVCMTGGHQHDLLFTGFRGKLSSNPVICHDKYPVAHPDDLW